MSFNFFSFFICSLFDECDANVSIFFYLANIFLEIVFNNLNIPIFALWEN